MPTPIIFPKIYPSLPAPLFSMPVGVVLSAILLVVFIASTVVGAWLFAPMVQPDVVLDVGQRLDIAGKNGTVVAWTMWLSLLAIVAFIVAVIRVKDGSLRAFMAINRFNFRQFLGFGVALLLLNVIINLIGVWLKREPMLFMDEIVTSAQPFWLLVVGMVLLAPIYEELIFRGFMWSALATALPTKIGIWLASVVTSVVFAWIHGQYGGVELVEIFALAMLFSYARIVSGSLLLPMVLHIINNGLAMIQYLG